MRQHSEVMDLIKVAVGALAMAASLAYWAARKRAAAIRLGRIDAGELCVACGRTELERRDRFVRCLFCGHVADLAVLKNAKVTDEELAEATKPVDERL